MDKDNILAVATLITGVSVAINWLIQWITKLLQPHNNLEKRVAVVEKRLDVIDSKLSDEIERIDELSKQYKLIMRSLLALLENSIDGSQDSMLKVREEINKYLIDRQESV